MSAWLQLVALNLDIQKATGNISLHSYANTDDATTVRKYWLIRCTHVQTSRKASFWPSSSASILARALGWTRKLTSGLRRPVVQWVFPLVFESLPFQGICDYAFLAAALQERRWCFRTTATTTWGLVFPVAYEISSESRMMTFTATRDWLRQSSPGFGFVNPGKVYNLSVLLFVMNTYVSCLLPRCGRATCVPFLTTTWGRKGK